jgi:hypothetical protein
MNFWEKNITCPKKVFFYQIWGVVNFGFRGSEAPKRPILERNPKRPLLGPFLGPFAAGKILVRREKKIGPLLGPSGGQICHMPIFLRKNIFSARLVFEPSRTAKKAAKRTRVGFRSCGSALATLLPPSTPDRAAGSEVPGSAGALVRFGAHSPPTRRTSCFMPRGTARARLTTNAAILPTR